MRVTGVPKPFGSLARTRVLLAIRLLGESYARELSRLLDLRLSGVQRALKSFEKDGLVAGRAVGKTRLYRINPSVYARRELEAYLDRLLELESELGARAARLRRRPRRAGKPL